MASPTPHSKREAPESSLSLDDVLIILFRHKWKILLCTVLGIAAAAAVYLLHAPLYESQAKLLVRYVVDTSANDPLNNQPKTIGGDSAIDSEVEILTSWDLAEQVAEAIGIDRLVPNAKEKATKAQAAHAILSGLTAGPKGGNVIAVSYINADPALAVRVPEELLSRYFVKHLEVHRSAGAFEFVARQTDQVRAQLKQTEEEIKELKSKAGVISFEESTTNLNSELARNREALQAGETEYAERKALVRNIEKALTEQGRNDPPPQVPNAELQRYQGLLSRLSQLREVQLEQLSHYTPRAVPTEVPAEKQVAQKDRGAASQLERPRVGGSGFVGTDREMALTTARERYRRQNDTGFAYQSGKKDFDTLVKQAEQEILTQKGAGSVEQRASDDDLVRINQLQTENIEKQIGALEKQFPGLIATNIATSPQGNQVSLFRERATLAGIDARMEILKSRIRDLESEADKLVEIGPQLAQLERKREIEDANYKYFEASLEKARIDEALDPSKIPNISAVQKPSPPLKTSRKIQKVLLGLAGGGLALGVALAFLIELVLNRSVKRPLELPGRLRIPLLLWIPYVARKSRWNLLPSRNGNGSAHALARRKHSNEIAPWDVDHFLRSFSEALRDRITLYFQIRNMNHKPKLVGVTGCSRGAGASTLAGGLAAALSETRDGKVLLVDMNVGRARMHPFFEGASACSLADALVGEPPPTGEGENLYLAIASAPEESKSLIPKRFYDLVPHLKSSDFDYIIFDMPCLSQTSITLAMAGYLDKVVLVAEAEKSNRDVLRRAYAELATVNANVSAVLNKVRFYAPKWLAVEG